MIRKRTRPKTDAISVLLAVVLASGTGPASAGVCNCNCYSSPLILDLDKTGFIITVDLKRGVAFDLDADGFAENVGWTYAKVANGFLVLDQNGNGRVDDGRELFGNSTILPDGTTAGHGFEALAFFDRLDQGGNNDGQISASDLVWSSLQLWVDSSHDGVSDPEEIFSLDDWTIHSLGLSFSPEKKLDGAGNGHQLRGSFFRKKTVLGNIVLSEHLMEDIYFSTGAAGLPSEIFRDGFESGDVSLWSCAGSACE